MFVRPDRLLRALIVPALIIPAACGITAPLCPVDSSPGHGMDGGVASGLFTAALSTPSPTAADTAIVTVSECGIAVAVLVTESSTPPAADAPWQTCDVSAGSLSLAYHLTSGGLHTLSVWIRDAEGDVLETPRRFDIVHGSMFAPGDAHTCSLVAGRVQCWGDNTWGQLGDGSKAAGSALAVTVQGLDSGVSGVTSASHANHSCALKSGGVLCWGVNAAGQLGNPAVNKPCGADATPCSRTPVQVVDGAGVALGGVVSISAGAAHTCARVSDGSMYCWGDNSAFELGLGPQSTAVRFATKATQFGAITRLVSGVLDTCALTTTGWKCVGLDHTNQVPVADFGPGSSLLNVTGVVPCTHDALCQSAATPPAALAGAAEADEIGLGYYHACARVGGAAVCWGANHLGQYGDGSVVPGTSGSTVALSGKTDLVISGAHHACARLVGGGVECWGVNDAGQLGQATTDVCSDSFQCARKPVVVTGLTDVADMAAGRLQTCAASNGHVLCWGGNRGAMLGSVTTTTCGDSTGHELPCTRAPQAVAGVGTR